MAHSRSTFRQSILVCLTQHDLQETNTVYSNAKRMSKNLRRDLFYRKKIIFY